MAYRSGQLSDSNNVFGRKYFYPKISRELNFKFNSTEDQNSVIVCHYGGIIEIDYNFHEIGTIFGECLSLSLAHDSCKLNENILVIYF